MLLPVALFFIGGCAGLYRKPAIDIESATLKNVSAILAQNRDRLITLKGKAQVLIETPLLQHQASSHIVIKRPDSVFIKIEAAFGIDVGWFFSDRQSYTVYLPFQNTLYSGSLDSLAIPYLTRFDLSYEQIVDALTGIEVPSQLDSGSLRLDRDKLVLAGKWQGQDIRYWIDPNLGVITQTEVLDADGKVIFREKFERIVKISGVVFPRTIRLERPNRNERVVIHYTHLVVNKPLNNNDFKLKTPKNAVKVEMD